MSNKYLNKINFHQIFDLINTVLFYITPDQIILIAYIRVFNGKLKLHIFVKLLLRL